MKARRIGREGVETEEQGGKLTGWALVTASLLLLMLILMKGRNVLSVRT